MGAFYNSICVADASPDAVRGALERWLVARGFRLSAEPNLFDLDAASERSVFLLSNDSWTIVLYSHFEEERRLIRELQSIEKPLVYLWVWDSDVWGFDLFEDDRVAASFSSDPRGHRSFADDEPSQAERPPVDAAILQRLLGLSADAAQAVMRGRKRNAPLKESVCAEVARLLGVEPAVSSYDELEIGGAPSAEGWRLEHLVYFHYDVARANVDDAVDVHDLDIEGAPLDRRILGKSTEQIKLSPELFDELEKLRRRVRWTLAVLGPLSAVARGWRRVRQEVQRILGAGAPSPPPRKETEPPVELAPTVTATRTEARSPRHGVRLSLPEGVDSLAVSGRPSAVFAFRVGALRVTCSARRLRYLREVLRRPSRAEIVCDEALWAGALPVRHVVFQLAQNAPDGRPAFIGYYVVQTFRGLYVFYFRWAGSLDESVSAQLRQAVESFRLDDDGPPRRPSASHDPVTVDPDGRSTIDND
ncbi:MAG: hypothetical protein AAGC60_28155 [Acidobacteriota bacterium]